MNDRLLLLAILSICWVDLGQCFHSLIPIGRNGGGGPIHPIAHQAFGTFYPSSPSTSNVVFNTTSSSIEGPLLVLRSLNNTSSGMKMKSRRSLSSSPTISFRLSNQLTEWWEKLTEGRSGLLLFLAPTIVSQFRILQTTVPFCVDRVLQYVQPLNLFLLFSTTQARQLPVLKSIIVGGLALGAFQMVKDSFAAGFSWLPAQPSVDSFALVTGASSGLGKAMAFQLYERGYNVILVARNETMLQEARDDILSFPTNDPSPQLIRAPAHDIRERDAVDKQSLRLSATNSDLEQSKVFANQRFSPQQLTLGNQDQQDFSVKINLLTKVTQKLRQLAFYDPQSQATNIDNVSNAGPIPSLSKQQLQWPPRQVEIIPLDLAQPLAPFELLRSLKQRGLENKIDILIANAGRGTYGPLHFASLHDVREQLELNIASTVSLIRLLVPRMIHRRRLLQNSATSGVVGGGRILVVSSVAGAGPGADIALYSAAKAFLSTFALSIRRELLSEGILVTVAKPGPLSGTNFLTKIRNIEHVPLAFKLPFLVLSTEDAASQILRAVALGREVVCPGFLTKLHVHIISKLLPPAVYSASVQRFWRPLPSLRTLSASTSDPYERKQLQRDGGSSWARTMRSKAAKKTFNGGAGQRKTGGKPPMPKKTLEERMREIWYQPVINYAQLKAWYELLTSGTFMVGAQPGSRLPDLSSSSISTSLETPSDREQEALCAALEAQHQLEDDAAALQEEEETEEGLAHDFFQSSVEDDVHHSENRQERPFQLPFGSNRHKASSSNPDNKHAYRHQHQHPAQPEIHDDDFGVEEEGEIEGHASSTESGAQDRDVRPDDTWPRGNSFDGPSSGEDSNVDSGNDDDDIIQTEKPEQANHQHDRFAKYFGRKVAIRKSIP